MVRSMNSAFWHKRWQTGDTAWHQDEFEPRLLAHFPKLAPTTVFVPFCGKSRDLLWLAEQGHKVIGVELSPIAVEQFFAENKIKIEEKVPYGKFEKTTGGNFTIYCGDLFELDPQTLQYVSAVYDRAALIALPADLQTGYAAQLCKLLKPGTQMLLLVLDYPQPAVEGPPFAVSESALKRYYGATFTIQHLVRERTTELSSKFDGVAVFENAYLLTKAS